MVEWLERQLDRTDRSTSQESIKLLRRDAVLNSLKDVPAELMEEIGNTLIRESKKNAFNSLLFFCGMRQLKITRFKKTFSQVST